MRTIGCSLLLFNCLTDMIHKGWLGALTTSLSSLDVTLRMVWIIDYRSS